MPAIGHVFTWRPNPSIADGELRSSVSKPTGKALLCTVCSGPVTFIEKVSSFSNVVKRARLEMQFLGGIKLMEDGKELLVKPKGVLGRLSALTYEIHDINGLVSRVRFGLLGRVDIEKDGRTFSFKPMGFHRFEYDGKTCYVKGKRATGKFRVHQSGRRLASGEIGTKYGNIEYEEDFDLGKEVLVGYGIWALSWFTVMGAAVSSGV
jgi:hypothetical protein